MRVKRNTSSLQNGCLLGKVICSAFIMSCSCLTDTQRAGLRGVCRLWWICKCVHHSHMCVRFLVINLTVCMVTARQDNSCGNECMFERLHIYLHVSKVTQNSTKMMSLKITHSVPIPVLASQYLAI
jgi:hypothetical protein